ncbi:cysteine desulfurase [Dehalococcoidia bacterium]|nr:cysteine desulfurase [Dehalococcoidia bacterium]
MRRVYLDNTATTPLHPEVLEAMLPYLRDTYGNPQSIHNWGDAPREAIEDARAKLADLIGSRPEEIIFTGSGTESNNLAIKGLAQAYQGRGKHIVISAIELFSVIHLAKTMEKRGFAATSVPVDGYGLVKLDELAKSIREDTIVVSIMHANGEVGTIQNIEEIAKLLKGRGIVGHPDNRLPGNASFCIEFIEGEAMLMLLSSWGIAASSGSACTSKALKASHVLTAMRIPPEIAQSSLLFTLMRDNTEEDIEYVLETLPPIVDRLRQMSPLYAKFLKKQRGGR